MLVIVEYTCLMLCSLFTLDIFICLLIITVFLHYLIVVYPVIAKVCLRLVSFVAEDSACNSNPCAKEALCRYIGNETSVYRCACKTGYYGLTCAGRNTCMYGL